MLSGEYRGQRSPGGCNAARKDLPEALSANDRSILLARPLLRD
jgi:hypothetical protein